jgi:hypothetical protein
MGRPSVDQTSVSSRNSGYSKVDIDVVSDSLVAGLNGVVQQLDRQLRKALTDAEQALEWSGKTAEDNEKVSPHQTSDHSS